MQDQCGRRLRRESSGAAAMTGPDPASRYAAWFHDLDAWTEYWDIYHPESKGRYYFGNGRDEQGLLPAYMPRHSWPG